MKQKLLASSIFLLTMSFQLTGATVADSTSVEMRKNAFYYEIFGNGFWAGSLNYDRNIRLGPKTGIVLRVGLSWAEKFFPLGEANLLLGNQRHHLEAGPGYTAFHEGAVVFLRAGYRFHGKKGMLVRVAPLYSVNQKFFWFGISLGYAF
jgi:hypothetical protein